jgi:hypothetical protein
MSGQTNAHELEAGTEQQTPSVQPAPKKKQTLTVRFRVENKEAMKPLWDAFTKDGKEIMGLTPRAMGWGDEFAVSRMWQRRYEFAKRLLRQSASFDELEKLDRLECMFKRDSGFEETP